MSHEVIMPALGMAQETGKLVAWLKQPGDAVAKGDVLMEVETDKSVMEVEAGHGGFVAALYAQAGEDVPVGDVVAVISSEKPPAPVQTSRGDGPSAAPPESRERIDATAPAEPEPVRASASPAPSANGRILASPKARRLAHEQGLDLAQLAAAGISQPYHVADLETLRDLEAQGAAAVPVPQAPPPAAAVAVLHIGARISAAGGEALLARLKEESGLEVTQGALWRKFAAAALREARKADDQAIVVETVKPGGEPCRFADPDRARLSAQPHDDAAAAPSLVLRDLSGTAITTVRLGAPAAPVLTLGRDRDDMTVALDFTGEQLTESQALTFIAGFAARLEEPLRYLV